MSLGPNGIVQAVFLSGSARRDIGSQIAVLNFVQFQNGVDEYIPSSEQTNFSPIQVQLDGYSVNTRDIPVVFNPFENLAVKHFNEYPFQVTKLQEVTGTDPFYVDLVGSAAFPAVVAEQPFDIDLTVLPGRFTAIQIKLDEEILSFDSESGQADFNVDKFTQRNYDPRFQLIRGFISDYVAFDISKMAPGERPKITTTGNASEKVYFSGDGIAISEGAGATSTFELLDPIAIQSGSVYNPIQIGTQSTLGTYLLEEPDPSLNRPLITSMTGVWRDRSKVLTSTALVSAVAFPTTGDSNTQQLVVYKENAVGEIVAFWEGVVRYNDDGDTTKGTFRMFPISTITDAVPTAEVSGTVSNLVYVNGVVRRGDWDITSNTPAGFPFDRSGGFVVLRR